MMPRHSNAGVEVVVERAPFPYDCGVEEAAVDGARSLVVFEEALGVDADLPILACFAVVQDSVAYILEEVAPVFVLEVTESLAAQEGFEGVCWAYLACTDAPFTERLDRIDEQT